MGCYPCTLGCGVRAAYGLLICTCKAVLLRHFQNLLESLNIPVLESKDFLDIDEAIQYVKDNPKKWVVKQNEHMGSKITFSMKTSCKSGEKLMCVFLLT